jgi:hypothetical protein
VCVGVLVGGKNTFKKVLSSIKFVRACGVWGLEVGGGGEGKRESSENPSFSAQKVYRLHHLHHAHHMQMHAAVLGP